MREQSGPFTQIGQGEKGFGQENANKVQRWREALRKAGNLTGWPLGNRLEAEFIQSVAEKISRRLSGLRTNQLAFHPVGIDSQLQALYSLLQLEVGEVRIVGISGTSGIGRTTLARALYHRIADQFDWSCFLENVKDISSQDGLVKMQDTHFGDILNDGVLEFGDNIHAVINFMRSKLHKKKVLLVFDDVEGLSEPLSRMFKTMDLGLGSRVILIPRHEETLIGLCGEIYKGTDAIEGIKLDKVDIEELILNADSFRKMKKLRLFMMADHVPSLWTCWTSIGKVAEAIRPEQQQYVRVLGGAAQETYSYCLHAGPCQLLPDGIGWIGPNLSLCMRIQ
ncbi:hypothetical protein NL676_038937 [Syzygium grande]|nr:hypothetical protein NL676_038937 [Syzygium grande]